MAAERLNTLKTRRSFSKGQQTRFASFLEQIKDKSDRKVTEISLRIGKLNGWFLEFEALQYEIEELDSQNTEEHDEIRKQFEDIHYALLVTADTLFENDSPLATNTATDPNILNGQLSSIHTI
ncbi:hypothetical protein JTB14_027070 [Gonioctena quinquepunctata]|nr:hypothetical protein JTB14_027070 [Gonioctena quinquepunctata]